LDDDLTKQGKFIEGYKVIGTLNDIVSIVRQNEIKEAVIALPLRAHERLIQSCHNLQKEGIGVHVIPDLFSLSFPNASLDGFGGIAVIHLGNPSLGDGQRIVKRIFDVLVASILLIVFSPLLMIIAIAIKFESPGPIIFRQIRVGENGNPFTMFKFRSMYMNSDDSIHRIHMTRVIKENITPDQLETNNNGSLKLLGDPRITRVGNFIRKTSIDEIPQLFNVLRGEMSLVGPRPPLPYELELYQEWHMRRLETLPGITGLWQVRGRNRVSFDEMVRMDLEYVEKQSLWTDVVILLQTPFALISTRGAG
jgi:exopolysaccharide biosynthesis polyprenyl glycosylphosphotransferase